jgi:anti-sigma regulatory factor (Ser/Thr protein kinase)
LIINNKNGGKMQSRTARGQEVRGFILQNISAHNTDIVTFAANHFGISRQSISKHIKNLITSGEIVATGSTQKRVYALSREITEHSYLLEIPLQEDTIWRDDIFPSLAALPGNIKDCLQYCFTEIFNNVIDHSGGTSAYVQIAKDASQTEIMICDNGEGIFKKIQKAMNLNDERHAILELAKGKLTTDPIRHTGEGIFFSSRMVDSFTIISGNVHFSHDIDDDHDWIFERHKFCKGTCVMMRIKNDSPHIPKDIFDHFASEDDDYGFTKTIVPVRLVQYGDELLVSRSQAKRLLARFDRFKTVILDFSGVSSIGQAFADEVFRVFRNSNVGVMLVPVKMSEDVERMIKHVQMTTEN